MPWGALWRSSHVQRSRSFAHRADQHRLDSGVSTLAPQIDFSHITMCPSCLNSFSVLFLCPFLLAIRCRRGGGYDPTLFQQIFNLFFFFLTLVALCPGSPLQVAAQVALFLGMRCSYSAREPRRTLHEYVKGWFSFT